MMIFVAKLDREQFGIRRAVNQTEYESLVALYQLDARTGNCSTNQQFEEYSDASEFSQHQLIIRRNQTHFLPFQPCARVILTAATAPTPTHQTFFF